MPISPAADGEPPGTRVKRDGDLHNLFVCIGEPMTEELGYPAAVEARLPGALVSEPREVPCLVTRRVRPRSEEMFGVTDVAK